MRMKVVKVIRKKRRIRLVLRPVMEKKRRKCLACGRVFVSKGPWNRLCRACRKKVAKVSSGFFYPYPVRV